MLPLDGLELFPTRAPTKQDKLLSVGCFVVIGDIVIIVIVLVVIVVLLVIVVFWSADTCSVFE